MSVADCLIYLGSTGRMGDVSEDLRPALISDPSDERASKCEGLIVWPGAKQGKAMKAILQSMVNLKYLRIGADLLPDVYQNIGESLETLVMRAAGKVRLSHDIVLPSVRSLMAMQEVVFYKIHQFPSARNFLKRWDSKQEVANEIAKAEGVATLQVSHVKSLGDIPSRDWSEVEELRIWRTRIRSLEGIGNFPNLKRLVLNDNGSIETLDGLQGFYETRLSGGSALREEADGCDTDQAAQAKGLRRVRVSRVFPG